MHLGVCACAAVALAGCNFLLDLDETRLGADSPQLLIFDNSASATDLIDFPVMVVPPDAVDLSSVGDPAVNIRFIDPATGLGLPFDIERFDPAGESVFWVRVPKITARSTTEHIEMHFGPEIFGTRDPAVWTPEFDLVVHGAVGGEVPNVAQAAYLGTADDPVTSAPGAIGDAVAMPNYIVFENSGALLGDWDRWTLELWLYADYESFPPLLPNTNAIELSVLDRGGALNLGRLIQYQVPDILRLQIDTHYTAGDLFLSTFVQLRRWIYVVFTFDGQAQWVYRDGAFADVDGFASTTTARLDPGTQNFSLGNQNRNNMQGRLDELRISHVARNADWVNAQFLSMTKRFVKFSPRR